MSKTFNEPSAELETPQTDDAAEPVLTDPVEQAKAYVKERNQRKSGSVVAVDNSVEAVDRRESMRKWLEYRRRHGHR
jgi:hypothetical protein